MQRRRLARAGLADDAQGPALPQFEADAVDSPHFADRAAQHHALGQSVGLDQIATRSTTGSSVGGDVRAVGAVETP